MTDCSLVFQQCVGVFGARGQFSFFCCFLHMYIEYMFTNTIVIYMTAEMNLLFSVHCIRTTQLFE